ncbi:hypothetical protein [Myxococcus virescens]|uniref:Uncharacterized protein n=1 Tax=Myxococcus virescens TaxID=83456 RepID=A0A511HAT5_9BACT|nr:hypothetical protein [Myxococcus virescens]GEL69749.1 hypothetical protein MVI01_15330 [Myxococcus virescens]SDD91856.1 hypothetical protein SAMN04488504_103236 [Myxococcus virescens]
MSSSSSDPRSLLDALRSGAPLPSFPAEAVESARALARDVSQAALARVEALPEPLALAVLEAAVSDGNTVLPEALASSSVKPLVKAAKKALYQLRSRGVAVAGPARATPAEPPPAAAPEALNALASAVTGDGERALVLARVLRGAGVEVVQMQLSDERGVVALQLGDRNRATWRKLVKDGLAHGGIVELPPEEAAALLAEAAGTNLRTRTPFPKGLDVVLRHFGVQPQQSPTELPPPEPEDLRRAQEADVLHDTVELASWLPPEPDMRVLVQKMDEVVQSPLSLSDVQRQEQLQAAVLGVARDFFTPEVRQRYALRLWRMADYFERSSRPREADIARAEARRLFHGAQEPFSRFAERLFEKVLALVAAAGARAGARPGADTGPAEAAPAPTLERRSPGGLIIP